jgi:diguanylate cyclase (GGDEF)-like protein
MRDIPTILIADDAPENVRLLGALLRDEGRILVATSGVAAIDSAAAYPPDLVLLDVMMPDMSGYEVCRQLKANERTKDIPIIFVTAMIEAADEAKGLELGAIDYISKPFAPPLVRARVRNHLALRRTTLELRRANEELTRIATTDPLTGVYNRRHFFDMGERELARARRYGHPVTALMLDIDHFKLVNDTYGHDIGDQAIIATAEAALHTFRAEDVFGRIGGEEFAGLLPETDTQSAITVAERLRLAIAGLRIPTLKGDLTFTASVGLAPLLSEDQSCAAALKRADDALYRAKNAGRNRVEIDNSQ